jgi:hypothetical protein
MKNVTKLAVTLLLLLIVSLTMNMEAACSSKTYVNFTGLHSDISRMIVPSSFCTFCV